MKNLVSLQINLSPGDYLLVKELLPHQLRTLSGQVDEILLTVETRASKGRFAVGWEENRQRLHDFLIHEIASKYQVRIDFVDYNQNVNAEIARYFFGINEIPEKDHRGGPFYAYFYGIARTRNDLVLHLDADIFLGGGSPGWIQEAAAILRNETKCLFVSPLPGPPREDDSLTGQVIQEKIAPFTYKLTGMSTRIFMTAKSKFKDQQLLLKKSSAFNQVKAVLRGNTLYDLPEHIFSDLLITSRSDRIDFLGEGKGMWSLHPPYRTRTLFENLPSIISRIETNQLPQKQKGYYDIIDEVCDWSEARENLKKKRWWKKLF